MIDIVNNSFEYWHFHNWDFFIRICDNDFSKYNDNFFIFFFDIVQYFCNENQCHIKHFFHCDQVVFFKRDQRSFSQSRENVIFKIRSLIFDNFNSNIVSSFYKSTINEYFLIEDLIEKISFFKIIVRRLDVVISRNKIIVIKFFINHIFNISNEKLKLNKFTFFIREKFKIQTFDKKWLTQRLNEFVIFFFFQFLLTNSSFIKMYITQLSKFMSCLRLCAHFRDKKAITWLWLFLIFMKLISMML